MGKRGFGKKKAKKLPPFELINHEAKPQLEPYKLMAELRKAYRIKKHDYQEFHAIIERHGLWDRDLQRLGATIIKQAQATLAFPVPVEAGASGEVTVQ